MCEVFIPLSAQADQETVFFLLHFGLNIAYK